MEEQEGRKRKGKEGKENGIGRKRNGTRNRYVAGKKGKRKRRRIMKVNKKVNKKVTF